MGQADVLELLEKNKKKWWSSKEIQQKLNHISAGSVYISVRKLRDSALVNHKLEKPKEPILGGRYRNELIFIKHKTEA